MLKELHFRLGLVCMAGLALYMGLTPRPPQLPIDWLGDKFAHMLAFSILALFARLGFRRLSDRLILERLSFAGALIEVFQAIPSLQRDCDWRDWAADTLAIAAVLAVMRLVPWRRIVAPARG